MTAIKLQDEYGNRYDGTVTKLGRKYVWVQVDHFDPLPIDRRTGRTSADYEDRNGQPMWIVR